ncbi:MAG: alpha/beta family hydrolase, partial [Candidatus Nanopelagicales bacterium]
VLLEQPWRVAGRRVATAAAQLDQSWLGGVASLPEVGLVDLPLVVGGRSTGARVAARTYAESGAKGLLALAFPLQPPARPSAVKMAQSRAGELPSGAPTLILQGSRDQFGTAPDFGDLPVGVTVRTVPWADHEFALPRNAPITERECLGIVAEQTAGWLSGLLSGESVGRHGR